MKQTISLFLFLIIGFISCKNSNKTINKVDIAKLYFKVLDSSDYSEMSVWFTDSLRTIEGDYVQSYSQSEYIQFLEWDAVFDPSYKILSIDQKD